MNAPRLILGLRDLIEYVTEHLAVLKTIGTDLRLQLIRMEQNMATKAELEAGLGRIQAGVTDLKDRMAAMQGTMERLTTEDAVEDADYEARLAAKDALIAELQGQFDGAVDRVNAIADAMGTKPA